MPNIPISSFKSSYVALPADNVDTDQIIPARFLTTVERSGLGRFAFHDWRYDADGAPRADFPLNIARAAGSQVLVAGHNFGCGSSREHAVWALLDAGFRAVISTAFADIFRGNALGNGLLPIQVGADVVRRLLAADEASASPAAMVAIDLASRTLTLPDGDKVQFPIAPFAQYCLLHGVDELDVLLDAAPEIERYELSNPAPVNTAHTALASASTAEAS